MCLDKIDKVTLENVTHGHKVFRIIDGMILGEYYNPDGTYSFETSIPYETGRWYKAGDYILNENEQYMRYPTGFHTFLYKEDAEDWKDVQTSTNFEVFKVEVSDIIASGCQYFSGRKEVVVSKRMRILEK